MFSNFACHEFDGDYGSFLKVDYSIDCEGTEHRVFSIYALACIAVYPLGIPLMYYMLLRKERNLLDPGQQQFNSSLGAPRRVLRRRSERGRGSRRLTPALRG